jgi:hypothetical protein
MSTGSLMRRTARPIRRQAATHRFVVGQTVMLRSSFGKFSTNAEVYRITGTLPPKEDSPQYRIRNDDERHERVATEDNLEPAGPSSGGATLIEKTFGATPPTGSRKGYHHERT